MNRLVVVVGVVGLSGRQSLFVSTRSIYTFDFQAKRVVSDSEGYYLHPCS